MKKIAVIAIRHHAVPNLFLHGLRNDNRKWALAGGHAIPGELIHEAASRELEQETGLKGIKLDKVHENTYGDNHVTLFMCDAPSEMNLNPTEDPDNEFVTFKYLDPTAHDNLHVPSENNILVEWMKSSLTKGQPVIKFPKVPDLNPRMDQELRAVPGGRSKQAIRQREIIARSVLARTKSKLPPEIKSRIGSADLAATKRKVNLIGGAGDSKAKRIVPGNVMLQSTRSTGPIYESLTGMYSTEYEKKHQTTSPGRSTQEHEAGHLSFSQLEAKYGREAQEKVVNHILAHFHPEDRNAVAKGLIEHGYSASGDLGEEIVMHMRDYLQDPDRRNYINKIVSKTGGKVDHGRLKTAWKNATAFLRQKVTPEWLRSKDSEVVNISEQASKLQPSQRTQEKLAASEEAKLEKSLKIKVEPFVVDKTNFDPKKHDFIVRAVHRGKQVGILAVTHKKDGIMPFNFDVHKLHRRKGFGTAMADHAQKISGKGIVRSPDMTKDAVAWADKYLGPAKPKKLQKAEEYISKSNSDYVKRAMNTTILLHPVSVNGKRHRADGLPIHMTIKSFGDDPSVDHDQIKQIVDRHEFHQHMDPNRMVFMPHKLKGLDGSEHHVLLVYGTPPRVDRLRKETEGLGPSYKNFLPHIGIDKEDWERISKMGNAVTAKEAGIQFYPAELKYGNTVIKTY